MISDQRLATRGKGSAVEYNRVVEYNRGIVFGENNSIQFKGAAGGGRDSRTAVHQGSSGMRKGASSRAFEPSRGCDRYCDSYCLREPMFYDLY